MSFHSEALAQAQRAPEAAAFNRVRFGERPWSRSKDPGSPLSLPKEVLTALSIDHSSIAPIRLSIGAWWQKPWMGQTNPLSEDVFVQDSRGDAVSSSSFYQGPEEWPKDEAHARCLDTSRPGQCEI